ncbi:hypothetical protein [Halomicronema sp. CCY15110]|uniref:hypothetical protein n=1 Tax=Halomicronema sp. CCY15110 TaxID=2767773 RepID=UPI001951DB4E|nr:hypothetical protein [Halomicronema sp. CCY15110]
MFATLSKPYAIAGQTIVETAAATYKTLSPIAIATYKALTSKKARRIYRDAWTITSIAIQVTFWLAVLAGLYSIKAGRQFRACYQAEWAADVEQWTQSACRLIVLAGLYAAIAGYDFRAYCDAKWDSTSVSESVVEPVAELTVADADLAQPEIPAAVQAILESNVKTTKKLRAIATHFDIPWRNARGEGKHMLNADIKAALSAHPEILKAL